MTWEWREKRQMWSQLRKKEGEHSKKGENVEDWISQFAKLRRESHVCNGSNRIWWDVVMEDGEEKKFTRKKLCSNKCTQFPIFYRWHHHYIMIIIKREKKKVNRKKSKSWIFSRRRLCLLRVCTSDAILHWRNIYVCPFVFVTFEYRPGILNTGKQKAREDNIQHH